ncbi:hypothetical protein RUM43_013345 [Polyplax serrata]|uniref:C3H1-type domain-containing protein n=1 Tax=Polyplax serrata TaxID=468196 RepID=A0AAN8S3T4_POLSC
MSSDCSDFEYEGGNEVNNSDSESENIVAIREEDNVKGPQTPKTCSPKSQDSGTQLQEMGFQEDSTGGIFSPTSDSQEQNVTQMSHQRSQDPLQAENADDDGRSDISSGSSLLSQPDNKDEDVLNLEAGDGSPLVPNSKKSPSGNNFPVSNADDLSDVSDLDDSDGLEEKEAEQKNLVYVAKQVEKASTMEDLKSGEEENVVKDTKEKEARERAEKERQEREHKTSLNMDDGEQLDFEAEDQPEVEKEDGEIELGEKNKENKEDEKSADEGEVKEDEESLEDGEVTDEGDPKPEKPPVCRFYNRNCCTWGINCRFLHPGVTDKGNYTMFDVGRPMVAPPNGPALYPSERPAYGHPVMLPPARVISGPYGPMAVRREEPALVESAWERGLRQAKEMMRKSTKRKETDMDFEEKKMNLSMGQDEIDKENDYYTRASSPVDDPEAWVRLSSKMEPELRRPVRVVERYEDIIPEPESPAYYDKYDYARRGYERMRGDPEYLRREKRKYYDEEDYPVAKKARRDKMVREVIVQRVDKARDRHHLDEAPTRRGDEWSDPWMRSKSPSRKGHRARKTSYSSGSSSFSSRSGSRSRSLSNSHSPVPRSRRPRTPSFSGKMRQKKMSSPTKDPKFRPLKAATPVGGHSEKKLTAERSLLMNPPAPTPKRSKERPMSPTVMRKVGLNPPPPTPKASRNPLKHGDSIKAGKVRSKKSRSSSGSGSSGSSSDSSHSSYSSSSSTSRGGTPPVRPSNKPIKKIEPNERLAAQTLKGKAMDALKISGQKPQIKLTLKPPETKREKPALGLVAGKKRPSDDTPPAETKVPAPGKPQPTKKTTSRREELLKQLKAVEDAIARKRSKI